MPRRPRDCAPGIFHVTTHSVRSTPLYIDDVDRIYFLTEFAATVSAYAWTCIEICLLDTHYHALIETPDASLPVGMHRINHRHACRFNARHRLRGHVTHARYFSDRITSDGHLLAVYAYIARNPVAAGLCDRSEDWLWSSHAALYEPFEPMSFVDPSRVLDLFGEDRKAALERLRDFVAGHVTIP